jgi:hypothetical protein
VSLQQIVEELHVQVIVLDDQNRLAHPEFLATALLSPQRLWLTSDAQATKFFQYLAGLKIS